MVSFASKSIGRRTNFSAIADHHHAERQLLLHAHRLVFTHPLTGETLAPVAPLDAGFDKALGLFGWSAPE